MPTAAMATVSKSSMPTPAAAAGARGTPTSEARAGRAPGGDRPGADPGIGAAIRDRIYLSMKHAVSLITARLSFSGQWAGAAHAEAVLSGGEKFYMKNGKMWRDRTHREVPPLNHSISDVQEYVRKLPAHHVVHYTDASTFPQYRGIIDFVTTMRVACEPKGSAFIWPQHYRGLVNAFSVALTHLPPGYMTSLRNTAPIPAWLQRPADRRKQKSVGPSGGSPMREATGAAMDVDQSSESEHDNADYQ